MLQQSRSAPSQAIGLLGERHPLLVQLGSTDGLVPLGAVSAWLKVPPVDGVSALAAFLEAYRKRVLLALELPAICRACHHAARHEVRELIALDQQLARKRALKPFAAVSSRVGRRQLARLRPLRDARLVQRYWEAVETGRAHAWHTLVFGLTLALYSLPVRQGLHSYACQALAGFISAAAGPLRMSKAQCAELFERVCAGLPEQLESIVAAHCHGPAGRWR